MKVDVKLYEFLQQYETGMFIEKEELFAYVHIPFSALDEWVEMVGACYFDEGGMMVRMMENTIVFDLNELIEENGDEILAYEKCFEESTIRQYLPELKARLQTDDWRVKK